MSRRSHRLKTCAAGLLLCGSLTGHSTNSAAGGEEIVDVELVLAVDVSLSMSPDELIIQRDGYAAALTDPVVLGAILDGAHGKIAVTYLEWAGASAQQVVVPWSVIASPEDARAFVARMTATPPRSARRTSISAAIEFAATQFDSSGFRGMKRVIDVSGDGPNNQGGAVHLARNKVVETGITINGLPLMTNGGGMATAYDITNLDKYYADCVIGGPGAFMIPVNDWVAVSRSHPAQAGAGTGRQPPSAAHGDGGRVSAGRPCIGLLRQRLRDWREDVEQPLLDGSPVGLNPRVSRANRASGPDRKRASREARRPPSRAGCRP